MYEINKNTMAICTNHSETIIYEVDNLIKSVNNSGEIIEYNCLYYGSSYKGRVEGSKNLIGISYKLPIILEETNEIIYFPVKNKNSILWINYKMVKNYYKKEKNTIILFVNDEKIIVNNSYESVNNQILKSSRLESLIRYRKSVNFL